MKFTFRWFGEGNDSISLKQIRQIPGCSGLMGVLDHYAAGEVWELGVIRDYVEHVNSCGLEVEVIESVNVHEDIKMGVPTRDKYIENYCKSIENLARCGIKVIVYNFMPVFDWLRTELNFKNTDGSTALSYSADDFKKLDPANLRLPGWDESYTPDELKGLLNTYKNISHAQLFENLVYFLKRVIPVCEETGINMAIHPDDPPWDIFSIPRIVSNEQDLDRIFAAVPSKANGLTFCTGSFGAGRTNDLVKMAAKYAKQGRIHFAHLRNILYTDHKDSFRESAHPSPCGSLDMAAIVRALSDNGFDGYVRPDHGRNIFGEQGKPGYGLYDRALGAAYIAGLFEAVEKQRDEAYGKRNK